LANHRQGDGTDIADAVLRGRPFPERQIKEPNFGSARFCAIIMMQERNMKTLFRSTMGGLLAASALAFTAAPAFAGDEERALAAIAQAQGKIDAATKLNASPAILARAQASLRLAQEALRSGKEQKAIASAIEAQQAADTVIGQSQQRAEVNAQVQAEATISAQQQADAANARASAAEQAAASSAADARAARSAAAMTAPTTTTVTTETVKATPTATRTSRPKTKVVRKATRAASRPAVAERTTTTVTTQN
jgi:hypothetical protein